MKSKTLFGRLARAGCLLFAATQIGRAQLAATISEIPAATPPVPGTYDASQLLFSAATGKPGGLNYYWDNGNPNGSTFWTGGNAGGYVLNSVTIKTIGGGGSDGTGGITTSQAYYLRLYSVVTNATSTNATLLAFYASQSFSFSTEKDWLQVSGLNLPLLPNKQYAYTFSRSVASYENLGFTNGIPATIGQVCEIPTGGGAVNFGSSANFANSVSGTFDIGMSLPSALLVGSPLSTQNPVLPGTQFILTSGTVIDNVGNGSYTYQWQTDGGGNGGVLTNIPGATSPTYTNTLNTIGINVQYDVVVTDSTSASSTSSILLLNVRSILSGTFTDITNAPTPGGYDLYQLTTTAPSQYQNSGLPNYYDNSQTTQGGRVGETFTTGNNAKGYSLSSVAIDMGANSPYNSGTTTPQGYDLDIYQISPDGTTAIMMADVTNLTAVFSASVNGDQISGGAFSDWIQWSFPAITLNSNTVYAYTFHLTDNNSSGSYSAPWTDSGGSDLFPGGQMVAIQETGGTVTYSSAAAADAVFDIGLTPLGIPFLLNIPTATPNPAYALSPVKLADTTATPGTYTYQWLTDDGTGATPPNYIVIPGATGTNATVTPKNVNPGGGDYTTNYYFVATRTADGNSVTSSVVTLTVHPASAPVLTDPTPTNLVTFVGASPILAAGETGTLPITNQWQFDNGLGGGYVSLTARTNTTLTLANIQITNSGNYKLMATNILGYTNTDPVTLTVLPDPAAPVPASQKYYNLVYTNNAWAYWRLNETTDPNINDNPNAPTVLAYDYTGHGFLATYGNQMTVSNAGPSSLTPGFPGFDTGELAAGTEYTADHGYLTVPDLNLSGNTNVTFIAWINPSIAPLGSAGLLFNRGGPDNACGFGFANNGVDLGYTWNNNSAATYNYDSGLTVAVDQWNFVAYVITPTNTTMYLGNLNNGTTNFSSAVQVINNVGETWKGGNIRLGDDQNSYTRTFPGLITEAALFTNALSTAQIQQFFITGIGALGLAPSIASTTISPAIASVYSGQNVLLNANFNGTAPLSAQWQSGPDGSTWSNIPGATNSLLVVNPLVPPGGATYYYQLTVTNSFGAGTNSSVSIQFNDLPATPPGLWTANFQETNNIGANQTVGGGVGHYVGRGILGTGMYWNILPHVLLSSNPYNANSITNVTDLQDNGLIHSGITCVMNNGGSYNSLGTSLPNSADIGNLLDQYYRTYYSPNALQFFGVPDGTYNLVCYSGNGATSQGANNYGSTFVVHDPVNGDQTNSTAEPTFATGALSEGVNFVTFTNVHVAGGVLNVDVDANTTVNGGAIIEGAQIQLVSYDSLVASFSGTPTNAFVGQAVAFTSTSTGFVTNAVWNFGDGTSVTNLSNASVSHSYAGLGTYTVSLNIIGPGGSSSVTLTNYIATSPSPKIGSAYLSGGNFILSGSNGPVGVQYRILTTTNVSLPLASWTPVYTNVFAANGSYSYTNSSVTNAASFFRLVSP